MTRLLPTRSLHGLGLPIVPSIAFHKDGLFKWLMTNFLFSKSDLDVATVSAIWMPKKIYLQKHNRTTLYHYKLTNTHDSGITSRHKISHNSCQWSNNIDGILIGQNHQGNKRFRKIGLRCLEWFRRVGTPEWGFNRMINLRAGVQWIKLEKEIWAGETSKETVIVNQ